MPVTKIAQAVAARGAALLRVRWFVRAPIWLYRARLGFVFGSRLLMLEHIGRLSGARRYVVLEIVARPAPGCYVVASGFGTSAQWYRNVRANPHVRIYVHSRRPAAATASVLTAEQGADALGAYAFAHPHAWRTVKPVFEATLGAEIGERATTLPLVALDRDPTVGPWTRRHHDRKQWTL
jgi:deazaflavin-dependent oxidoreductase (nitroreductase family)